MNIKNVPRVVFFLLIFWAQLIYASPAVLLVVPEALPINWATFTGSLKKKFNYDISVIEEQSYQGRNTRHGGPLQVITLGVEHESADIHIALRQDPLAVFEFLRQNVNSLNTIHIVFDNNDEKYILRAQHAARQMQVNLVVHGQSGDVNLAYLNAFDKLNPETDILWIVHKIDKRVRFHLLKQSWKKKAILISNYTADVQEGVTIGFGLDVELLEQELLSTIEHALSTAVSGRDFYLSRLVTSMNKVAARRAAERIQRDAWLQFDRKF